MEQNFNEQIPSGQNPVPEQTQAPYNAPQAPYTEPAPQAPYQPQPAYQQPYNPAPAAQPYQPQPQAPAYPYPPQPQAPAYPYQQPQYPYQPKPRAEDIPGLNQLVNSAFSKGLASTIMAELPIASIIAIIMGSKAKKLVNEADRLAAKYGIKAPGKRTAAKILGNVGFGLGIGMTVFWTIYIIYLVIFMARILETNYHF